MRQNPRLSKNTKNSTHFSRPDESLRIATKRPRASVDITTQEHKGEEKMFKNCKTLEELKTEYHKLVLLHHPDRGGDEETMKAVNASYDKYFPILKTIHTNKDGKQYTKETDETPEYFKDIMNRLMAFEKINIEIIGCFIWVTGETKPIHGS